jgi:hypothetical protein
VQGKASESLVYEDGKQRRSTGTYGGGRDPDKAVAPVKKKVFMITFVFIVNIYRNISSSAYCYSGMNRNAVSPEPLNLLRLCIF